MCSRTRCVRTKHPRARSRPRRGYRLRIELGASDGERERRTGDVRCRNEPVHRPDDLPHTRGGPLGQIREQLRAGLVLRGRQVAGEKLLAQCTIGRLHLDDEATLEARSKPILEAIELTRWPVAAEDELLALRVERIEDVKELFLRALFPGDELHVTSEVLSVRPSKSRPDQGVIKVRTTTLNQHDEPVQVFVGNLVVLARKN